MLELLTDPNAWAALATLTVLEIVLGIDNVVFISILVSRCSPDQALRARQIGLSLAFIFRIAMLFGLTWLMKLTYPLFSIFGIGISWRDIILIGGGMFLIAKATHEIHAEVEHRESDGGRKRGGAVVCLGGRATGRGRSGLFAQLDHHRDRHGERDRDHDRRGGDRDGGDVRQRPARSRPSSPPIRPPRCWRWRSSC